MKQEVDKKTALIVGLGASGLACAHHLGSPRMENPRGRHARGARRRAKARGRDAPMRKSAPGGLPESLLDGVSLVVMSPGLSTRFGAAAPLGRERQGPATLRSWARSNSSPRALADLEARTGYLPRRNRRDPARTAKTTTTTLVTKMAAEGGPVVRRLRATSAPTP